VSGPGHPYIKQKFPSKSEVYELRLHKVQTFQWQLRAIKEHNWIKYIE
jgi:hypothetical protein